MALIHLLTAQPKAGKTEAALGLAGPRAIFFVPSPRNANPKFSAIPWAWCKDLGREKVAAFQKAHKRARLVLMPHESQLLTLFMGPEWEGYTFVFDDFPQLFPTGKAVNDFVMFACGVRHRDGEVIVCTQRIAGVLPPLVRALADQITQVGPLVSQEEAKTLYTMGASAQFPRLQDFYLVISKNPPYKQFPIKSA